jgi:CRP-like cAMP-binding protein
MSDKMKSRLVGAGTTIYGEGDPSDAVYLIEQGEVEVLKGVGGGEQHLLGILGPGKIFGESGVILGVPRSATARARTNVVVKGVDAKVFIGQFRDAPLALPILKMLCERLNQANKSLVEAPAADAEGADADARHIARIRLIAASDFVKMQIGQSEIDIGRLPYRIGRKPTDESPRVLAPVDLALVTRDILQMSLEHLAIASKGDSLVVEDLASEAGTWVNGVRIARFENTAVAPLRWGENEIVIGPQDSPLRFLVIVERKAD